MDHNPTVDEIVLIACVRSGDPVAAQKFYDDHVADVYRDVVRLTRDPELARECTQDVFLRAFDRLGQFRGEGPVIAWLRKISRSVVFNALARLKVCRIVEVSLEEIEIAIDSLGLEPVDRFEALNRALATLSVAQRSLLLAFYGEGYTHQEIATTLGISVGASKVRLSRARAQLRRLMVRNDLSIDDIARHQ